MLRKEETARRKAVMQAEKEAEVSLITMERRLNATISRLQIAEMDGMGVARGRCTCGRSLAALRSSNALREAEAARRGALLYVVVLVGVYHRQLTEPCHSDQLKKQAQSNHMHLSRKYLDFLRSKHLFANTRVRVCTHRCLRLCRAHWLCAQLFIGDSVPTAVVEEPMEPPSMQTTSLHSAYSQESGEAAPGA